MVVGQLAEKLRLKEGQRAAILNAPAGYLEALGSAPVQLFVHDRAQLEAWGPKAVQAVKRNGLLWISYPKKSSGIKTDITRDAGWEVIRALGLEPVSQIAIDDVWSALRFRPSSQVKRG